MKKKMVYRIGIRKLLNNVSTLRNIIHVARQNFMPYPSCMARNVPGGNRPGNGERKTSFLL